MGTANIGNVLTNGTTENSSFKSKLDYVASELQMAKNANVAVLWAPFHEYQPNGWFWWSKGTAQQFIQLWQYMFNYLTNTKGLNNLIWLAPSSGSPNASWYPGKAYVDLAGPGHVRDQSALHVAVFVGAQHHRNHGPDPAARDRRRAAAVDHVPDRGALGALEHLGGVPDLEQQRRQHPERVRQQLTPSRATRSPT